MISSFNDNGYVHIKDFLDKNNCYELTTILKELIATDMTTKDDQCPISEAIYGAPTFDILLEELLPYVEDRVGKKLYPTYSYARLYKPGEELKKHKDRPACEISATVTLGFDGDVWSIYMDGNKVDMQVGDAVIYRGMEVEHWREKYTEGEWQAQVFLHYVDANGPHADQKYDGRPNLNTDSKHILPEYKTLSLLSEAFCDSIVKRYSQDDIEKEEPFIGLNKVDKSIRDVGRVPLPRDAGISGNLTSFGLNINNKYWKYHITHSEQSELLIYKPDGHYIPHVDCVHMHDDRSRKITVVAFLNDDYEGGKFFINANGLPVYPQQTKGTVIAFPSYMVHGVEPVTKGTRYSCVTWLEGPYFK